MCETTIKKVDESFKKRTNDLGRRNGRVVCVISPNSVALWPYHVKVIEDTRIHSASEM